MAVLQAARQQPEPEPEPEVEPLPEDMRHLPPLAAWPDRPSLVRCDPDQHTGAPAAARVGVPFEFKTRLFEGRAVVRIRGVDEELDSSYFRDRERRMACLIQGCFTERVRMSDVVSGQEFTRRLNLPLQFVVRPVLYAIQVLQPALQVNLYCAKPYLLTPLAATAQTLAVARPGEQSDRGFVLAASAQTEDGDGGPGNQDIMQEAIVEDPLEDTALLGGCFGTGSNDAVARKRILNAAAVATHAIPATP